MSDISPSSLKLTPELEEALKNASHEEMKSILANATVAQGLATRDIYDSSVLIPTNTPQPRRFAESITVGSVKRIFEGDSEGEVKREINEYLRQQLTPTTESRTEVARDENTGRFVSPTEKSRADENTVNRIELELKFKRGDISTADYLEQSGAIEQHLESRGISIEDLKASVEEKNIQRFTHSWASATQDFLNSPEGSSWPGGQENMKTVSEIIQQMGAIDAEDKVAAIATAYKYMQQNGMVGENRELNAQTRIREAKTVEEIRAAASSLFGR